MTQSPRELNTDISAYWGVSDGMTVPTMPVVLVRRGNHLSLFEDAATPSACPNAARTANAVTAAIATGTCYILR